VAAPTREAAGRCPRTPLMPGSPVQADATGADSPRATALPVPACRATAASVGSVAIAAIAALVAVVGNRWLFPLYSLNRDDSVYVAMARTIQRGHLTLPESHWPFRPWATGLVDGRYAFKYAPPWPVVLAVADAVGSLRLALAATAAATVLAVRSLAVEVLDDAVEATIAAALLVASPLFLVQSSTYLPYLFSLLLACASTTLLMSGVRQHSRGRMVAAGALAGIALFARPFDAVVLLVPAAFVGVLAVRGSVRRQALAALAIGFVPVASIDLLHNWIVLGSPLSLPFGVTGSADAFGFGRRGVFESSTLPFDFLDGLSGAGENLRWLPSWTFGGPFLVALAVWGAVDLHRATRRPAQLVLLWWVVVVPIAYVFFWGPWAMAFNWDGVETFGPFYHLPLLVPLVVFGARGMRLLASKPHLAIAGVAAMVAFTAWSLPDKLDANEAGTEQFRAAEEAITDARLDRAVLFLPWRGESGFLGLTPFLEYDPDVDDGVLYAQDCGTATNLAVLDRFPDRTGYRLEIVEDDLSDPASYAVRSLVTDSPDRHVDCPR
jgi:4-amino-4-deoxy-L-arabinose transferase-like glycosyltransferase